MPPGHLSLGDQSGCNYGMWFRAFRGPKIRTWGTRPTNHSEPENAKMANSPFELSIHKTACVSHLPWKRENQADKVHLSTSACFDHQSL